METSDTYRTLSSQPLTLTQTRLSGRWLWIARAVWAIAVVVAIGVYVVAIPFRIAELHTLCYEVPCGTDTITPAAVEALRAAGLSLNVYIIFLLVFEFLLPTLCVPLSLFLFWRRSDDWMALLLSATFVLFFPYGSPTTIPLRQQGPLFLILVNLIVEFGRFSAILLLFLFPNGRFAPRWFRWLAMLYAALQLVIFTITEGSPYALEPYFLVAIVLLAGFAAQVYRYRRVSTATERQQTKWVGYGFAVWAIVVALVIIASSLSPTLNPNVMLITSVQQIVLRFSVFLILYASAYVFIITLAIAILRNRLWDIDPIVNRSLVYAGVTLVLGLVFAGAFFGLRALLESILGSQQSTLAAIIATGAILLLFNPTRKTVTRFVDRRLYGIQLDYREVARAERKAARSGPVAGRQLGEYALGELVGRGGMGEVYRATHTTTRQEVAVKVLPTHLDDENARRRFLREAQATARLDHPGIVALREASEDDGTPYMVMDFVGGQTLHQLIRQRAPLSLDASARIMNDLAAALDYAHAQGIVHRDIKPSNVMVENEDRTVLMDFGIAKLVSATALTQSGIMGTLDYVAPEQIQGARDVDPRADIYSLGIMVFQMLTGELPFKNTNPAATVMAHLMQPPPDPREKIASIPTNTAKAVMRAMAKKPDERFESAGSFATAMGANVA